MKYVIFFTLLILSFRPAMASEQSITTLCKYSNHNESNVPSAEYVPGVDVYGNPVTSADLGSSSSAHIYNPVIIPIEVDLAARYGFTLPAGVELKPTVADIKIFQDGRIQYNGKDISNNIETLCSNYQNQNKKIQSNQAEQHGHESHHPVISSDKIEGRYPDDVQKRPKYND